MRKLPGLALSVMCCLLVPVTASAYVGPGAGLSAIGSFLALIAAVVVAVLGFLWYPIKRMLNKNKEPTLDEAADATAESATDTSTQDTTGN